MIVETLTELDAHEQPSDQMRALWKSYSKTEQKVLLAGSDINDLESEVSRAEFKTSTSIPAKSLREAFAKLDPNTSYDSQDDVPVYYHPLLPSLLIIPSLIPPAVQRCLLSKLIHRDLSKPKHQTNLHLHYTLPYQEAPENGEENETSRSFFVYSPSSPTRFVPHDPQVHKPLSIKQVLERRLHWVTLGGQYDWTARVYPSSAPPSFPQDIAGFLETLFPQTAAQAAIVNFYTPGDNMMMHRDVSEEVNRGLVSLSMGCDALFMIAPNDAGGEQQQDQVEESEAAGKNGNVGGQEDPSRERGHLLLRIRSGDAIYMTGEARYAWHGVPKVLQGTCPDFLADWPAEGDEETGNEKFGEWRGWMRNKRINLNVRQMN